MDYMISYIQRKRYEITRTKRTYNKLGDINIVGREKKRERSRGP